MIFLDRSVGRGSSSRRWGFHRWFHSIVSCSGAADVVAVDVGHNQLAWKIRSDPRVTTIEGANARSMSGEQVGAGFDLAVADLSFISLTLVLDNVLKALAAQRRGHRAY